MPHKVRTGIIGLGNWGKNVARELNAASDLVAVATSSASGHEAWLAEHLPSARRTTPDALITDPAIQAVAIVTPIPLLAEFAHAALNAGKHVFVEKPLAQSAESVAWLADLAGERGLVLSAGYVFLYHPVYLELKRRVKPASVRAVQIEWRKFGSFEEPIEHSLLVHHLSLMLDLFGEPTGGRIEREPGVHSACDRIETHLAYPTLDVVSSIDRTASARTHRMAFELNDGTSLVWEDNLLLSIDKSGKPVVIYDDKHQPLTAEIVAFIEAVSGGPQPPTAGPFAARVLHLLERLK